MRVLVRHAGLRRTHPSERVDVIKEDNEGDVYLLLGITGGYFDVPSVKKLIRALEWAIAPTPKRRKKS